MNPLSVLGLIFVVLKLVGVIAWSWWLVLAPFLISAVVDVLIVVGVFFSMNKMLGGDK